MRHTRIIVTSYSEIFCMYSFTNIVNVSKYFSIENIHMHRYFIIISNQPKDKWSHMYNNRPVVINHRRLGNLCISHINSRSKIYRNSCMRMITWDARSIPLSAPLPHSTHQPEWHARTRTIAYYLLCMRTFWILRNYYLSCLSASAAFVINI